MEASKPSRAAQIDQLVRFQGEQLANLRSQLSDLDAQIAAAEAAVLRATNVASAARGLVGQRGGRPPRDAATPSRARPKQRLWALADGTLVQHAAPETPVPGVTVAACGVVYSAFHKRFEAPRQSFTGCAGRATILLVGDAARAALGDVRCGDRLWVVCWLDRNGGEWRHFVRPPRAKGGWRVGVFATRSPNRPSPLGLSLCVVEELDREKGRVEVRGVDILDETPLIGLKAYEASREAHPGVKVGWVDEVDKLQPLYYDDATNYSEVKEAQVLLDEAAETRLAFIDDRSTIDVREMVTESLKRKSFEEELEDSSGELCGEVIPGALPVGAFRVLYEVYPRQSKIVVRSVVSGMRREVCMQEANVDPEAQLHLDFQGMFPHNAS